MTYRQPLAIIIRIPDVALALPALEAALKMTVSRYEHSADAPGYAQISIADGQDQWVTAFDCIQAIRPALQKLLAEGLIGSPYLDVALAFPTASLSASLTIPAALAAIGGETGLDIKVSVYLSDDQPA